MAAETAQREASPPEEFDTYSLVLLSRPADTPKLDEAEANRLQRLHLGHLATMREQGALLVAGPFSEQWDVTMRGLCLYRVEPEEARRLAELDPAVQQGWFKIDVMRWWTAKGAVQFP
jgi:uncharacterized protein